VILTPEEETRLHCWNEHRLPPDFQLAEGATWMMLHNLLHRLKGWDK